MTVMVGANLTTPVDNLTDGKSFGLGDRYTDQDGKEYVYVQASAAIAQYDVVTYDETFDTTVAPLSTSNDAVGDKVGVAPAAFASGDYGWLQIYGPCTLNSLASTAANTKINTTATAGSIDDDATSGAITILGMYLTAAQGGSAGSVAAVLNYPFQDATL